MELSQVFLLLALGLFASFTQGNGGLLDAILGGGTSNHQTGRDRGGSREIVGGGFLGGGGSSSSSGSASGGFLGNGGFSSGGATGGGTRGGGGAAGGGTRGGGAAGGGFLLGGFLGGGGSTGGGSTGGGTTGGGSTGGGSTGGGSTGGGTTGGGTTGGGTTGGGATGGSFLLGGFLGGGGSTGGGSTGGGSTGGGSTGGGTTGGGTTGGGFLLGGGGATGGRGHGQLPSSKGSPNIMYPYGPKEGDRKTPNIDDGAVEVPISVEFTFFNKKYRSLFVNNNGVISFGVAVSKYTPDAFPLADGSAFVAPYWGDVNTMLGGNVYYRETTKTDILQRVSNDINHYLPNTNYKARWAFIATWDKVAYFGSLSDRVNTFQAVLTTDGKRDYIILNYADIQWTTGTASKGNPFTGQGGIAAQAGFNSGDDTNYFNIPGSHTADIINIATTSNVNVPGRWVFRVDKFSVPGGCVAGANFAKFGDIFWKDDACEEQCTCQSDGETNCTPNECSMSEVCKPSKWFFLCDAPDSCI